MSSDNAILVLCLKDQYRVTEAFAIDNLYWSWINNNHSGEFVLSRIFEYFNNSKKFQNKEEAFSFANKLYSKCGLVEYGVIPIEVNKTWLQVLNVARKLLAEEKMFVINSNMGGKADIIDGINYSYSDVLKSLNEEKYAKQ